MPKDLPTRHPYGARIDNVTHMCPGVGCGWPVRAFCPVCLGVGEVTEERLAQWHREHNAQAAGFVVPARSDSLLLP